MEYDSSKQQNYVVSCNSHRIFTTVTSTPSVVRNWIGKIRHYHRYRLQSGRLIVGVGVQWNPYYRSALTGAATLQLCVGHRCLIFQLKHADRSPLALERFLSDPDVIFVGISNSKDEQLLRESKHRLRISRLVDVRHVASDVMDCDRQISMGRLAEEVLGFVGVEKKEWIGRSEWDDEWLSEEQVEYACADAFVCFLIAKTLMIWRWNGLIQPF